MRTKHHVSLIMAFTMYLHVRVMPNQKEFNCAGFPTKVDNLLIGPSCFPRNLYFVLKSLPNYLLWSVAMVHAVYINALAPENCGYSINTYAYCGLDEMAAVFQTTYSNTFSWMKMYKFRIRFHLDLFSRVQLKKSSIGSDIGLAPSRRQGIIWTNYG